MEGSSEQVGSFGLKMGKNKFCLTAPGTYELESVFKVVYVGEFECKWPNLIDLDLVV